MRRERNEFLDYLRYERNASAHTIAGYRRDLGQFGGFLEERGLPLRRVDNVRIRGFMAELRSATLCERPMRWPAARNRPTSFW